MSYRDTDCHATAAGRGARAVLALFFPPGLLIIDAVCLRFFSEFVLYSEEDFEFKQTAAEEALFVNPAENHHTFYEFLQSAVLTSAADDLQFAVDL